jgi:hypothetical protein
MFTAPADQAALDALAASDRPFEPGECAQVAQRAAQLIDAVGLPRTGPGSFALLWRTEYSAAWLNTWWQGRDTGYHDHDGSAAGVYVIEGSVTNEGLPIGGPRRVHHYGPGESFSLPGMAIHRMDHAAGAVTVHVYSPPLRGIGSYELHDGLLQRVPGPPDEGSPASPDLFQALDQVYSG